MRELKLSERSHFVPRTTIRPVNLPRVLLQAFRPVRYIFEILACEPIFAFRGCIRNTTQPGVHQTDVEIN
jgi:hypothetical protein